ncbi:MAG: TolC family protein [Chromatiales bacterium]|nr:TolC family protein [Chromatiales bacterium]
MGEVLTSPGRVMARPAALGRAEWGLIATLLGAAAWATPSPAVDVGPRPEADDLPALIQEAIESNPEIRAAAQRVEAGKAMIPQARTLPDPMLSLSYEDMPVRETMYGVSQEIPFPGKLRLKGEVAARGAEAMEQDYVAVRLRVIARLKETYYDLYLTRRATAIIERNQQLLKQFAAVSEAGYEVGTMAQADVFRAQAEVSRGLARLATLRQREQSLGAEMSRLLNRSSAVPVETRGEVRPTPLRLSLNDLLERLDDAPMVRATGKVVERGDASVALARREYLPDFEVGVQGIREEPMGDSGYQLMLNVTVPLYFANKQRYAEREARAARAGAASDLEAVRQELTMQVRDEVAQIERAEKLIALLEGAIVPQVQLTLASARSAYAVGRVDFLTLLNSLYALQENELELVTETAEHEKARARLEAIIGEEP